MLFRISDSYVVVCPYCRSAIARGDRAPEDLGKVADFVASKSRLALGLGGTWRGTAFTIVGHCQMGHPAGGNWDEWYAYFSDGKWGWLAEAQGRVYLTFAACPPTPAPRLDGFEAGAQLWGMTVAEKSEARAIAAEGELPFRFEPNATWPFADLSGPDRAFGTIDYGEDPPRFYYGSEVTYAELGFDPTKLREAAQSAIKGVELNCPNCHGPLPVRAPNESLRVTCPSCDALLDVQGNKLAFLQTLKRPEDFIPMADPGTEIDLLGKHYTVLGVMRRSVKVEGTRYPWMEYLLHTPELGFRWLVEENGHFNFVEPVGPGDVVVEGNETRFRDKRFRIFQTGSPRVDYVRGEFYWKVQAKETVESSDYIRPPEMLSCEQTKDEITWSHGTYVDRAIIKKAFSHDIPDRVGVAADQPYPGAGVGSLYWKMVLAAVAIAFLAGMTRRDKVVLAKAFTLTDPYAKPTAPKEDSRIFFTDPIVIGARQNLEIDLNGSVDNSWLYVSGDLVEESTGRVMSFDLPLEYYHGVDDGESWSEGGTHASTTLPAPGAGIYTLRLEAQWDPKHAPPSMYVKVREGVTMTSHLILVLFLLSVIPVLTFWRRLAFEGQRWSESNFGTDE